MEEEDAMEELDSPHNTQEEGIMEEEEHVRMLLLRMLMIRARKAMLRI